MLGHTIWVVDRAGRVLGLCLAVALALPGATTGARTVDRITIATDKTVVPLRLDPDNGFVHFAGGVSGSGEERVRLQASRCGAPWRDVAEAVTSGGAWRLSLSVEIGTAFRARWKRATSRIVKVGARPFVSLERGETNGWWLVQIYALRSFRGRTGLIERASPVGWRVLRRVRLTRNELAETYGAFRAPRLRGTLRAVLPRSQTRPCYLAGYSTIVIVG